MLIAHRCGPGKFPEQSIASARNAIDDGADMVEMDIQYTKDRIPVICHDLSAKRMFGEDTLVSEMTFEHFMSLRQIGDRSYPSHSLDDVLQSGLAPILFHCKFSGILLADFATRIKAAGFEHRCVIGVLDEGDVAIVKRNYDIPVLAFMPEIEDMDGFLQSDADSIRLWEGWVTAQRIDMIHQFGKKAWIMACKNTSSGIGLTCAENLLNWKALGSDGILINDIPWARSVLIQLPFL